MSGEAADARSVTLRRGAAEERAVRDEEGAWQLEAPIEAEADRVVVREVVRQIVELRAERFVAARPTAEHGLASPASWPPCASPPRTARRRVRSP
ncbi:MAG: hypothetical protein M5U28_55555 [Sandaracinaceae bacterium]|nr:hypothetical protein [Sandaracinaceae bacterium]